MSRTYHHTEKWRREMAKKVNTAFCCFGIPPKHFRKMLNKIRRAKEKQAMIHGEDPLPDKKSADWDWW